MMDTDSISEADFLAFLYDKATLARKDNVGAVARAVKERGGLVAIDEAAWHKRNVREAIAQARAEARSYHRRGTYRG